MRSLLLVLRGLQAPAWCSIAGSRHQIITVHGPAEAERQVASSHVDVVLLESGTSPAAVASATKALARSVPVVVIGPQDAAFVREALLAGADDYLDERSISASGLALAVECALARREVQRKEIALRDRRHAIEHEHEQSRLRTALINHLADRLLNPTTIIRLQASILAKEVEGVDAARLQQMQAAAERLRATVEQIAYAFEAQSGSPNVLTSPQRLAGLHDKAVATANIGPCRVEGDAEVEVDPVHVEEILTTALRWGASVGPGRLTASIHADAHMATYRLWLPGAVAADQKALFNPFYGLEDPEAGGDMGLGLYAARLNARRMGGDLRLANDPECCIIFDIPLQPVPGPPTRLIIDSTPRRGRWIGRAGNGDERLLAATSWHAARRLIGSSSPSRIVIGTPADVDGADLAHLLRERYPEALVERLTEATFSEAAGMSRGERRVRPGSGRADRRADAAPDLLESSATVDASGDAAGAAAHSLPDRSY